MYGLYTPLVGALNGQRRFLNQAVLDVIAATLRTVGLIVGSWWFVRNFAHLGGSEADIAGMNGASFGFLRELDADPARGAPHGRRRQTRDRRDDHRPAPDVRSADPRRTGRPQFLAASRFDLAAPLRGRLCASGWSSLTAAGSAWSGRTERRSSFSFLPISCCSR